MTTIAPLALCVCLCVCASLSVSMSSEQRGVDWPTDEVSPFSAPEVYQRVDSDLDGLCDPGVMREARSQLGVRLCVGTDNCPHVPNVAQLQSVSHESGSGSSSDGGGGSEASTLPGDACIVNTGRCTVAPNCSRCMRM